MIFENEKPYNKPYKPNDIDGSTRRVTTPYTGLGKLPPQATDQEEAILGGMMNDEGCLMDVISILSPDMFYKDNHQKIFTAIKTLSDKNEPVDFLTVIAQLRKNGQLEEVGGAYFITELTENKSRITSAEFHARIIEQKFLARQLISISTETINSAYEDTIDILELLEHTQERTLGISINKTANQIHSISNLVAERKVEYHKPVINGLTGISCGLSDVDRISHGWQKTDLIIVAARPSMGKTAFALQCAKHPCLVMDLPVAIFSLEMSAPQLTDRMISSESDILLDKLLTHNLSEYDFNVLEEKSKLLSSSKLFIDDTGGLSVFEFRAKCRRLKSKHDIQLIIVDYLQLMTGKTEKSGNREQEISSISRTLKAVAKELKVPVIALSQLSRAVESRPGGGKKPMLSDLRESGSIEQDADVVLFLYRDEYYGIMQDKNGESTIGVADIIFAKNRNGVTQPAKVDFNGAKMRFKDLRRELSPIEFTPINQKSDDEIKQAF